MEDNKLQEIKFNEVYRLIGFVSNGKLGNVYEVHDEIKNKRFALKKIKDQDMTEIRILEKISKTTSPYKDLVVGMEAWFKERDSLYLAMELLPEDLFSFLGRIEAMSLSFQTIASYAKQMIEFLCFMAEVGIIHGDVKPENILLCGPAGKNIKFADFGLGYMEELTNKRKVCQTKEYRSPEVFLGCQYDASIDVWGVGCVLVDLLIGKGIPLFAEKTNFEIFAKIVDILGLPPADLIVHSDVDYCEFDSESGQWTVWGFPPPPPSSDELRRHLSSRGISSADPNFELLLDLVKSMLCTDPSARISPLVALQHPFLKLSN